jgi:hypothetical protein
VSDVTTSWTSRRQRLFSESRLGGRVATEPVNSRTAATICFAVIFRAGVGAVRRARAAREHLHVRAADVHDEDRGHRRIIAIAECVARGTR